MFEIQLAPRPQPIQVPNMPLVTPASPAVTGDTAGDFIKAIREGFITSQDIADRLGELGQSQRAAEIQKNREVVDPAAIAARATARDAAAKQATLAGAEAEANLPLVKPRAEFATEELKRKKAGVWFEKALQAHEETGRPPIYFLNDDGTRSDEVDAEQTAEMGAYAREAKERIAEITKMLQGELKPVWDSKLKQTVMKPLNSLGQPVAPGDPAFEAWSKKLHDAYDDYFYPPTVKPRTKAAARGSSGAKQDESARQASEISAASIAAKRPAPVVPPSVPPVATGAPAVDEAEKQVLAYTDDVRKSPQYQAWSEKMSAINALDEIEKAYATNPEITNVLDSALAGVTLQLLSPGPSASARSFQDFRVANIEEHAQTLREKIADLPEKLLGKDRFEPGARARIIAEARRLVTAKENSAATVLKRAQDFATAKQADPFFDDKEKAILARAAQPAPPPGAPGAAAGTVQTQPGVYKLPSGRTISFTPRAPAPASKPFTPAAPAPALVTPKAPATEQDVARGFVDLWRQNRTP